MQFFIISGRLQLVSTDNYCTFIPWVQKLVDINSLEYPDLKPFIILSLSSRMDITPKLSYDDNQSTFFFFSCVHRQKKNHINHKKYRISNTLYRHQRNNSLISTKECWSFLTRILTGSPVKLLVTSMISFTHCIRFDNSLTIFLKLK